MWFIPERTQNTAKKVFQLFRRHRGFSDLLSYVMALDDCTVLHQDGALSRYFRYIAPDLESSTDQDLDFHASTWSQIFQFLGDGWMLETNVLSQPFHQAQSAREFPECVSALINGTWK